MEKYEDKIYSLGEAVTGQTQAMSQACLLYTSRCV